MSSSQPTDDFQLATGSRIFSRSTTYTVQSILGQGSFGTVAKCTNMCDNKTVAIKTMKYEDAFVIMAKAEVNALLKLSVLDSDKSNVVQWNKAFIDRGHFCLEFEHLDRSLYDFMKERYFRPLLLREIRPIIQQVANALDHLKTIGMIHGDLKPANIMLVDHQQQPYRVKVIDFGLAGDVSAARLGSYIQTRPFRSPEILLGLPYTEAIDMWSLGIIAAEMYLGALLYPGMNEYDMMKFIVETQGQPPDNLLNEGLKTSSFFRKGFNQPDSQWKLKPEMLYFHETKTMPMETRRFFIKSLDELLNIRSIKSDNPADRVLEIRDMRVFIDMLKGMLQLDAANRLTPRQVLEHPFISMRHITSMFPYRSYVRSSLETMAAFQDNPGSNSGNAGESSQPSPPTKTQPSQQNLPAPQFSTPYPQSSWTPNGIRKGIKRKVADDQDQDDRHQQEDPDLYQKSPDKRKRFRNDSTGWTTSSTNSLTPTAVTPKGKRKVDDNQESGHGSCERSERKRKRTRSGNDCHQTDPQSPPTELNRTPYPGFTQAEDQGVKTKAARDEDENMLCQRSNKRKKTL